MNKNFTKLTSTKILKKGESQLKLQESNKFLVDQELLNKSLNYLFWD